MSDPGRSRIGLALGSGAARGWAHIGVLRALRERGIVPDVICGTSIGALVGAAAAAGALDELEQWVRELQWHDVVGYLDLSLVGGLIKGRKLFEVFEQHFADREIQHLPVPFAAVATDLESGLEMWLREGSVLSAVRASIALPGLFTPMRHGEQWLVDGGLVNPVPVSLCRAMGARFVVAVDLNVDLLDRHPIVAREPARRGDEPAEGAWLSRYSLRDGAAYLKTRILGEDSELPSILEVIARSINIMQVRITRSRMAGDPPDVLVTPRLAHIGLMEFHRAAEAIEAGRQAVERARPEALFGGEGVVPR